jgi:Domain of unknown function (DUF4082)
VKRNDVANLYPSVKKLLIAISVLGAATSASAQTLSQLNPNFTEANFSGSGLMRYSADLYRAGVFPQLPFITPVTNQGGRNTCGNFSSVGVAEIIAKDRRPLSPQHSTFMQYGQNVDAFDTGRAIGLESEWPYNTVERAGMAGACSYTVGATTFPCSNTNHQGIPSGASFTAFGSIATSAFGRCTIRDAANNSTSPASWKTTVLTRGQPAIANFYFGTSSFFPNGSTRIQGDTDGPSFATSSPLAHYATVVAYIPEAFLPPAFKSATPPNGRYVPGDYLIVKNSWGTPHGDGGFLYVPVSTAQAFGWPLYPFKYDNTSSIYSNCPPRAAHSSGAGAIGVQDSSLCNGVATYGTAMGCAVPPGTWASTGGAVELGVKFRPTSDGIIRGVRFYRHSADTRVSLYANTANIWTTGGTQLATNIARTPLPNIYPGWQTIKFNPPIAVTANTTYIASYHSPDGMTQYAPGDLLTSARSGSTVSLLSSQASGGNGVYRYNPSSTFPSFTTAGNNYGVDVDFVPVQTMFNGGSLGQWANTGGAVELGYKFKSAAGGVITGIKIYGTNNDASYTVNLWKPDGTRIGTATCASAGAGWQPCYFWSPVSILPADTYVASVFVGSGWTMFVSAGFTAGFSNNDMLSVLPGGGVYKYTATSAFPNGNTTASYMVDVMFSAYQY